MEVDIASCADPLPCPPPLVQALDARAEALDHGAERPQGFGFPMRVRDQDPAAPIYLYSATISSIDRSDLAFEAVDPPFGTPISPRCSTEFCLHAAAAGDGWPTFIANLLIHWATPCPSAPNLSRAWWSRSWSRTVPAEAPSGADRGSAETVGGGKALP